MFFMAESLSSHFFSGKRRNYKMFSYSDFKMALSLTILGDVVATTLKFINNART